MKVYMFLYFSETHPVSTKKLPEKSRTISSPYRPASTQAIIANIIKPKGITNANIICGRAGIDLEITYTEGKMTTKQYSPIPATRRMKKQMCWSRKFL